MPLQLWVNDHGHFFVDTELGGVQVGQAFQGPDGSWEIEVNDTMLTVPDLESAKRIFLETYDRSLVVLSPESNSGEVDQKEFEIVDLPLQQKSPDH